MSDEARAGTTEPMGQWYEWWKASTENWQKTMSSAAGGTPGMSSPVDQWKQWTDGWLRSMQQAGQAAGVPAGFGLDGVGSDVLGRMGFGQDFFLQIGKMWLDSVMEASRQGMPDLSGALGPQSVEQVQELWRRQLARFAEAAATMPFGGSMANLFGGVQNVGDIARAVGSRLGTPWTDATRDLTQAWNASLRGDTESFRQFVKTWKETYDKTYGRLLQAPTLGYSREPTERLMRSLDAYVDYLAAIQEFMTILEKVGRGAAQRWVNRVSELAVDGGVPSHKTIYRLYMDTFEDNYYMVFRSREYSRLQAQVVDSGLRFKRRLDQALEDIIGQFPVATHSELNELYEAFYELRKQVKAQARRIRELEDKLASHAP